MANWFLRGLCRGVVTTRYPRRADPSAADLPGPPTFDGRQMDQALARLLVSVCPSAALSLEADLLVLDISTCTACQRCLPVAGRAGRPSARFEWAARDRRTLRVEFPLGGSR